MSEPSNAVKLAEWPALASTVRLWSDERDRLRKAVEPYGNPRSNESVVDFAVRILNLGAWGGSRG